MYKKQLAYSMGYSIFVPDIMANPAPGLGLLQVDGIGNSQAGVPCTSSSIRMPATAPSETAPLHQLGHEQQFLQVPIVPISIPSQNEQIITKLRNENIELKTKNRILVAQYTTLFIAYHALLRRIPNAVGINRGPLEQANFPDVKFWYLADWTQFCSSTTGGGANPQPTVITGGMQYVEDQHGHVVSGESVHMIWSLAQSIWFELGISGAASRTWGQVDVESKKGYYRAMAAGFFELRLCDSNWKAEKIANDNYALWLLKWRAQTQGPETSDVEEDDIEESEDDEDEDLL